MGLSLDRKLNDILVIPFPGFKVSSTTVTVLRLSRYSESEPQNNITSNEQDPLLCQSNLE
jgi:hypothetical protein